MKKLIRLITSFETFLGCVMPAIGYAAAAAALVAIPLFFNKGLFGALAIVVPTAVFLVLVPVLAVLRARKAAGEANAYQSGVANAWISGAASPQEAQRRDRIWSDYGWGGLLAAGAGASMAAGSHDAEDQAAGLAESGSLGGLPDVNIDGVPMIDGAAIDVLGRPYGTTYNSDNDSLTVTEGSYRSPFDD